MAQCPHCGNELDFAARPPAPWWKYDPGPTANLGCGTLILIAIIVALFSRGDRGDRKLDADIQKMEQAVEALGKELRDRPAPAEKPPVPDQKG